MQRSDFKINFSSGPNYWSMFEKNIPMVALDALYTETGYNIKQIYKTSLHFKTKLKTRK